MRPSIISVSHQAGRGLVAVGRFTCGHQQTVVFPHADRRTPRRELREWMFGARADEQCTRCQPRRAS